MHKRRGFSVLELVVVFVIIAILAGLGFGAYARHRRNTALNQAASRLSNQVTHFLTQARAGSQIQARANVQLGPVPDAPLSLVGVPECRVLEGRGPNSGIHRVQQFALTEGNPVPMTVNCTNLPRLPLVDKDTDTGLVIDLGVTPIGVGTFQSLCTILINPDGTVLLPLDNQPGRIVLDNGLQKRLIEISRMGKVTVQKI